MARYVKLTVVYDMDDKNKPLGTELQDWVDGNIGLGDINQHEYSLEEISADDANSWYTIRGMAKLFE